MWNSGKASSDVNRCSNAVLENTVFKITYSTTVVISRILLNFGNEEFVGTCLLNSVLLEVEVAELSRLKCLCLTANVPA